MITNIAALIALGMQTSFAQTPSEPTIKFENYELENGLDVILSPDHSTPIVHVNVWYHVGSRNEAEGLTGFAHLFEHLMFQGSASQPDEYFAPLTNVGASLNGTTNTDRTNYFETVPAQHLPLALFLESDRMGWLLPELTQDKLDNQREVVRNERRQRYENPPYGNVRKYIHENLYPKGHPYHHLTIGTHEDLEAAQLDDVIDFFKTWYGPNNASLVVSGDFDIEEAKMLIEKYFGNIPAGPAVEQQTVAPVVLEETKKVVKYQAVPEQRVWLVYPSPALYADGDSELDLFSHVISGGKDSKLYYELVKNQRIAKTVQAYQASALLNSQYVITGTPAPGHTSAELVEAIDAVLANVLESGPPSDEDLDAARANFEVGFYKRIGTIEGRGELLNSYNFFTSDPGYLSQDLARYLDTNAEAVHRVAQETLSKPRVEVHILPESDKPADQGEETP